MQKRSFWVALGVLAVSSVALADVINVTVEPRGDGSAGKDRYGFNYGWENVAYSANANPNWAGYWYDSGSANGSWRDVYMQVALADLPQPALITKATLNIYITNVQGTNATNVYHAANSAVANGNASQLIACNQLVGNVPSTASVGWRAFDVTSFILNDLNAGYSWAAFSFIHPSYAGVTFHSGENATYAPYLSVTAIPEPTTVGLLTLGSLLLVRRRYQA